MNNETKKDIAAGLKSVANALDTTGVAFAYAATAIKIDRALYRLKTYAGATNAREIYERAKRQAPEQLRPNWEYILDTLETEIDNYLNGSNYAN